MHADTALPDDTRTLEENVRALERTPDVERDLPEDLDAAPSPRTREGLPKSYRSRHDRHYVEQLNSATGMPLLRMLAVSRIDAANLPQPEDVTALTASVARLGVLQPLLVRAHGDRFVLIAGRKRLVAAREARCREVPCLVHTADEARALEIAEAANAAAGERRERVPAAGAEAARAECDSLTDTMLPEINHALASVQRALRLLPQSPAATRDRVAMRLMSAEVERAQWLVRCRRYLSGRLTFAARQISPLELAQELRALGGAIALHGGHLEVEVTGAPAAIAVDAALLTTALHGLVWAMLALGETVGDPRVRVTASAASTAPASAPGAHEAGGGRPVTVLEITQPTVVLNQSTLLRFFDTAWKTRPGGATAELAVQMARYAAARHDAELEVSSGSAAGTTVTFTLR